MPIKCISVYILFFFVNFIVADEIPEVFLSTKQLVTKYGYPIEFHDFETKDGYSIKLYRIPHGKRSSKINKKTVLIMHGLLHNAEFFIISGVYNSSLAYNLADNGFDVWLGNTRGNYPSRKHRVYSFAEPKFWDYSFHDFGINELPMTIDYILNKTNEKNIFYIGYSQGTILPMIMNHYEPKYNEKIRAAAFLAPAISLKHTDSAVLNIGSNLELFNTIKLLLERLRIYVIPPLDTSLMTILSDMCKHESPLLNLCDTIVRKLGQLDSDQFNSDLIPIIAKNVEPASLKQLTHFVQMTNSGRFQHYDYKEDNQKIYGSAEPPEYNVTKTTFPIGLFYGKSDAIVNYKDVEDLGTRLTNHVFSYLVPDQKWNHIDFCFAVDGYEQYQRALIKFLNKFS